MEKESRYTLVDLFAGCGGLSLGLEQAGFETVFFNEIVSNYASTYIANRELKEENYYVGDINNLIENINDYSRVLLNPERPISLVSGGPPCQGFSMANRQRIIDDPRNQLYKAFLRFLSIIRPKFFVMENVKGMSNKIGEIYEDFESYLGEDYHYDYRLYQLQDFGIPQNRERFFLIGNRLGIDPSNVFSQIETYKREPFVLRDVLKGLPKLRAKRVKYQNVESPESGFTEVEFDYLKNDFYYYINGNRKISKLYNHKNRYNNPRDVEIFSRLPQGADSLHESIEDIMPYKNRRSIFKDKYFKLDETKICKTITAHMQYDCNMYIHPWEARGLSPREAARIQTFPDDYIFTGPQNSWYAQIGNAVPVKFAEIVGLSIIEFL